MPWFVPRLDREKRAERIGVKIMRESPTRGLPGTHFFLDGP